MRSFRSDNFPLRVSIFGWQFMFFFFIHCDPFIMRCFSFIHQDRGVFCSLVVLSVFSVLSVNMHGYVFSCGFRVAQDFRRTVIRDMAQCFAGTAFDGRTVFSGMTRFMAMGTD